MTTPSNEHQKVADELRRQIVAIIKQPMRSPVATADIAVGMMSTTCVIEKASDIAQLFYKAQQANTKRILDRVEKDVIGENEELGADGLRRSDGATMNNLRFDQRKSLAQIRNEELGSESNKEK